LINPVWRKNETDLYGLVAKLKALLRQGDANLICPGGKCCGFFLHGHGSTVGLGQLVLFRYRAKYKVFSQILNRRFLSRNNFGITLCMEDDQKIDHKKLLINIQEIRYSSLDVWHF